MKQMRTYILITIIVAVFFLSGLQASAATGTSDKKIYHSEDWDILLLYPDTWDYISDFGDNVPVILHPPPDMEPDGFVMLYFLGEGVVDNLEEMAKDFEGEYLKSYDKYEILSVEDAKTKEGYAALDYNYTFVENGMDTVSNTRLLITEENISWMILFDRPPDCPEAVEKEAMKIVDSIVFSAAEYLANSEK